jgi:hypothetical protein
MPFDPFWEEHTKGAKRQPQAKHRIGWYIGLVCAVILVGAFIYKITELTWHLMIP